MSIVERNKMGKVISLVMALVFGSSIFFTVKSIDNKDNCDVEASALLAALISEQVKSGKPSLCLNSLDLEGDLVIHGVLCCDNPAVGCFVNDAPPPVANNDFACTRAGEEVLIDILANDVGEASPIDPSTVIIEKNPDHAFSFSVNPVTGVVSYVADTRFTGQDEFSYTVSDMDGVQSPHIATVTVDVQCRPALTDNPRFIYASSNQIIQYNGGVNSLLTTATVDVNAMATNRDDNLIYYAQNSIIYAYDYIANNHFEIVDVSMDPQFTAYTNLSDGGATYFDGVYYVAGSGDVSGYYRVAFDQYVPGSLSQAISNVYFIPWSDGFNRDMADMQYDPISGNLIVCSSRTGDGSGTGDANRTVSIVTPDSGVVLSRAPFPPGIINMQIARGPNNVFYVYPRGDSGSEREIRTINPATGQFNVDPDFGDVVGMVNDMSEYICQPCSGLGAAIPVQLISNPVGSSME